MGAKLSKKNFGHHLSHVAQLRKNAEIYRKEARKHQLLANKFYRKAGEQDEKLFKIIDEDFVELYKRLPSGERTKRMLNAKV